MIKETSGDQVVRMLALIAYLEKNPGVSVDTVAEHFGVTARQVLRDVDTLWVSGTPGYLHGDLIDFAADDHEHNILTLTDARGMDRPLRLGPQEAVALLTALRTIQATPDLADAQALNSAAEKLARAAGQGARAAESINVHGPDDEDSREYLRTIRAALTQGRQVEISYVSASDVRSCRRVDPLQLLTDSERWFLIGWCHRAGAVRQFRVDRMLAVEMLEEPSQPHPEVILSGSVQPQLTTAQWQVRLVLTSPARWVAEQYPATSVDDLAEGQFAVEFDVVDLAWLHNLLLGLADQVVSVSPAEVAQGLAIRAKNALDAYRNAGLL